MSIYSLCGLFIDNRLKFIVYVFIVIYLNIVIEKDRGAVIAVRPLWAHSHNGAPVTISVTVTIITTLSFFITKNKETINTKR